MKENTIRNVSTKNFFRICLKKIKSLNFFITTVVLAFTLLVICIYESILNYDDLIINKHAQFLEEKQEQFVQIERRKSDNGNPNRFNIIYPLNDFDINRITQKLERFNYNGINIYRIANLHIDSSDIISYEDMKDILMIPSNYKDFYNPYTYNCNNLDIVEWGDYNNFFTNDIIGRTPENNDEIIISNHLAELFISIGIRPYGEEEIYYPDSYISLLKSNKYFHFGPIDKVKIVGIINYDLSEFEILKNMTWKEYNEEYYAIREELYYRNQNIYNKVFVNREFINNLNISTTSQIENGIQYKVVPTAVLILETTKNGFSNLLSQFKMNEPLTIKSTYSEIIDEMKQLTDSSILIKITRFIAIIFIMLSVFLMNNFIITKKDIKDLKIHCNFNFIIYNMLWNSIFIGIASLIISFIGLRTIENILKSFILHEEYSIFNPFYFGNDLFIALVQIITILFIISYLIVVYRTYQVYLNNKNE